MDEPSIPGPYKLATAPSLPALEAIGGKPAGAVTRGYRHGMGKVQKLFRWLNESAYLVSVPFLMCLLLGLAVGNHSLMVLGATAVVVLNIGRIVAGVANLVVIPFRESPIQGVFFLIPPITFFYMYQNWHKVHKPVKRIVGPILTIALVAAAFVAEPWLRGGGKSKGSLKEQVKSGVGSLKKEMREQIGKVPNLNVDHLKGNPEQGRGCPQAVDCRRCTQGDRGASARCRKIDREPGCPAQTALISQTQSPHERPMMSHADDLITTRPADDPAHGDEEIELEPTIHRAGEAIALREGSLASFAGETDTLRRKRLLAAAVFLAATLGLLCSWVFVSDNPGTLTVEGSSYSLRVGFVALRCVLATVVAGLLASEVSLTRKQLRVVEYVLFLGLTLLLAASQYFVGLDLMHRGSEYMPMILAFIKDAVIQMMALMMIYGTLIPNTPAVAARTLVAMFVIPVVSAFLLRFHPDVAPVVAQLGAAEEAGSNILFLGIGAALAIYGAFLVNGLRTELHEARKLGQYQLGEKLGEGGMGEVYLAEHQLLKRPCALKLIKPGVNTDPIALARFEREVQAAAMLSHPNTIEIFDYGHTDDGTFYYVMQYLPGMTVSDLVRQSGPMPPGRVIYVMRQVCGALAEAHRYGLVHGT